MRDVNCGSQTGAQIRHLHAIRNAKNMSANATLLAGALNSRGFVFIDANAKDKQGPAGTPVLPLLPDGVGSSRKRDPQEPAEIAGRQEQYENV